MTSKIPTLVKDTSKVQLELPSKILKQLLQSGMLHGGDCKCLNATAKRILWQTLLATSTNNTANNNAINTEQYLCV